MFASSRGVKNMSQRFHCRIQESELHGLVTPFRIKQSKNRRKEKIEVFHIMFILQKIV